MVILFACLAMLPERKSILTEEATGSSMNLMDDPAALLRLLMDQKDLTRIRETFDRALRSVPVIHHDCIWELYLQFVRHPKVPIWIVLGVYERYLKFDPTRIEEFIDFLLEAGLRLKNSESVDGKSGHQLWLDICKKF
ncbi:hypothetical protein R1sor_006501 [Riccia sorocarpa]|uniref:Pre-mRNA-splicing factor Syf1-like N-terminal HAT-repeats domain-containing protein n=1 Tax=Riccia sorocarpa TaxID=122646 RepID=A0ABD3HMN3_9MARC